MADEEGSRLTEFQLLDGRVLDALNDGDWMVVGPVLAVLVIGLVGGFVSWLKGRKFVAFVVWALLAFTAALLVVPLDTIQRLVEADSPTLNWSLIGMSVATMAIGLVSAIRLARPPSWWAQRRYDNDRYAEAIERHHWTRPQAR